MYDKLYKCEPDHFVFDFLSSDNYLTLGSATDRKFHTIHHHMWHSIGKEPIWSFLEMEILRKIGEIVKK